MSKSIGVNTDPLEVEMYIENGLIKGRIISTTIKNQIENTPIIDIEENILTKLFTHIYSIPQSPLTNFTITNYNNNIVVSFNDRFEYFDFMSYAQKYNIYMNRQDTYNHYCTHNNNIILKIDEKNMSTDHFLNIIMTAKERMMPQILIILGTIPHYNIIEQYEKEDIFMDYNMIVSTKTHKNIIIDYNALIIKNKCYDELITMISENMMLWRICIANYTNLHIFETFITEQPIFT